MPRKTATKKSVSKSSAKSKSTKTNKKTKTTKKVVTKASKPTVKKPVVKQKSVPLSKPNRRTIPVKKVAPIKNNRRVTKPLNEPVRTQTPVYSSKKTMVSDDELGLRLNAALSYCLFLILVPVLTKRKNAFVNWHIRQGVPMLVFTAIIIVMLPILNQMPIIGPLIVYALLLLWMALFIWAIVATLLGHQWKFPIIGDMASKIHI